MNQRLSLFKAGFSANCATFFFEAGELMHEMVEDYASKSGSVKTRSLLLPENDKKEIFNQLNLVSEIAGKYGVPMPAERPYGALDYKHWRDAVNLEFEKAFPMSRIEHYYFVYGRRIAEIISNVQIALHLVDLSLKNKELNSYFLAKACKYLIDTDYVLYKMMASAALLSGEHRHFYFNTLYKEICHRFKRFSGLSTDTVHVEELPRLHAGLTDFLSVPKNGLKKANALLEELGI